MGDDERVAYLGRDDAVRVPALQRADPDGLRKLLADPAVWVHPDPTLEDRVVGAIASARSDEPTVLQCQHRVRNTLLGVAAALVLTVGVVSSAAARPASSRRFRPRSCSSVQHGPQPDH